MKETNLNAITVLKMPAFYKIRWRDKESERIETTRWQRKYTKVAEWHYFWEIECRGFLMYIPLEEQYDFESAFEKISASTGIEIPSTKNGQMRDMKSRCSLCREGRIHWTWTHVIKWI